MEIYEFPITLVFFHPAAAWGYLLYPQNQAFLSD